MFRNIKNVGKVLKMINDVKFMENIIKQVSESKVPEYWSLFLKKMYDCLLKVGFTEEQAMDILLSGVVFKYGKSYER